MHDVHQTIEVLGTALGLEDLQFDADGNLTLAIDGDLLINIHKHDTTTFEIWTALRSNVDTRDPSLLASLLIANHLGEGTGASRLALTPDRSGVVLCVRLSVEDLSERGLERHLADFIRHATFWNSPHSLSSSAGVNAGMPVGGDEPSFMIRA
ncbi:type III secretion system chaperone [Aureimonas jatrophae]|jgi:hypothetical protein|uniref:Tir chaperone protein (CesT) family protein n=1 Tax=Aureimonas jatrophae TaxID=1166073 RepID=A0A1H0CE58_9HYPH|nr:type III secretion system chaperone [Aureimonas jatrophae]MBB3949190.1 hypothetical protein [Aureimonas jatrophae]SDN56041.1 Tir chaperone protein (CesT) family protein [Aureimonas jatrophae]